jgi:5-methylcytosine-specific restriction endonuclease McrA
METELPGTSLGDYGGSTYEKYHFTCVYCGFDGRTFDSWMQLSIDHVVPRSSGGSDAKSNLVVCCRACNSITSRLRFDSKKTFQEIFDEKRKRVASRRPAFYEYWLSNVAPKYLKRPLPDLRSM